MSIFVFVSILVDDDKMILCKAESLNEMDEAKRQKLIKKAFAGTDLRRKNLIGFFKKIPYKVIHPNHLHSLQFQKQVEQLKEGNDWEESPFMAFWIHKKGGMKYLTSASGDL